MIPPTKIAAVVGAGPAGVCAVGALLDGGVSTVIWVDPLFDSGRLSTYPLVPSNTKTGLFVKFARGCKAFQTIWEDAELKSTLRSVEALEALDQDQGCPLALAVALVRDLTTGLQAKFAERLKVVRGMVTKVAKVQEDNWKMEVSLIEGGSTQIETRAVLFTTGSAPTKPEYGKSDLSMPPHVQYRLNTIDLDDCLNPVRLAKLLENYTEGDIAVIGSSHSAVLVMKNLAEWLKTVPEQASKIRIKNFYRNPFKYAQYLPEGILFDNTGLKGVAAEWAKDNLDISEPVQVGKPVVTAFQIERILTTEATQEDLYSHHMKSCRKIVYSIGYTRNPLPLIEHPSLAGSQKESLDYQNGGQIIAIDADNRVSVLEGLFGYGIAFPQRVQSLDGSSELAVGLWKFMCYIIPSIAEHVIPLL